MYMLQILILESVAVYYTIILTYLYFSICLTFIKIKKLGIIFRNIRSLDFPGDPIVKTPCFHRAQL